MRAEVILGILPVKRESMANYLKNQIADSEQRGASS